MSPRVCRYALPLTLVATLLAGCAEHPETVAPNAPRRAVSVASTSVALPALVRQLALARGVVPLPPATPVRPALVSLGQMLAFDRILSGNRDIACSSCHLPHLATGDGKSLSVGQGGLRLGPSRSHPQGIFIPRNAPPLFNLAAMRHLFWDGRVQLDPNGHLLTPAGRQLTADMERTFEFGAVSALGMFPVTNREEMRAQIGNELAEVDDADFGTIWTRLMSRLGALPEYRAMFEAAYPGRRFEDMTFAHASNAIGGFLVAQLHSANTPWDRFLGGDDEALSARQLDGAQTFLSLKCSICHNGSTLSDEQFHNVAVAQIGPGKGNGLLGRDDFGRMNVTGLPDDRYRFRTTSLRNVELTGPYGHDGAIRSLRDFVEHYSESDKKLLAFDPSQLELPLRGTLLPNAAAILAQRDTLLNGVVLTETLVGKLMSYLSALTDPAARDLGRLTPARVPSGLPVDRP